MTTRTAVDERITELVDGLMYAVMHSSVRTELAARDALESAIGSLVATLQQIAELPEDSNPLEARRIALKALEEAGQ